MSRGVLASIGYERRSLEEFIERLEGLGIEKVLDIRELPLSRRKGFSKTALGEHLSNAGIVYRHLRSAGNPYRSLKADVERCLELYSHHLEENPEVIDAVAAELAGHRVAILCYERNHECCHRSILIDALSRSGRAFELVQID